MHTDIITHMQVMVKLRDVAVRDQHHRNLREQIML
jgi:hypothetical protein